MRLVAGVSAWPDAFTRDFKRGLNLDMASEYADVARCAVFLLHLTCDHHCEGTCRDWSSGSRLLRHAEADFDRDVRHLPCQPCASSTATAVSASDVLVCKRDKSERATSLLTLPASESLRKYAFYLLSTQPQRPKGLDKECSQLADEDPILAHHALTNYLQRSSMVSSSRSRWCYL